ncbi:hypothetical protein BU23DRAFT_237124 [Bimuria novae-zelandiae CBS 107.79]|uniref:Uncharacterized protein n=1 Tax=Bimuria novae-zelandiae CBS 107.79 TaxID=1447943 RepID=A0A6A5V3F1_9PLEO|nr:hypothetical protein BU23DRAFT_237124 [Bimuria novae-zelandiae CBS 107.79]
MHPIYGKMRMLRAVCYAVKAQETMFSRPTKRPPTRNNALTHTPFRCMIRPMWIYAYAAEESTTERVLPFPAIASHKWRTQPCSNLPTILLVGFVFLLAPRTANKKSHRHAHRISEVITLARASRPPGKSATRSRYRVRLVTSTRRTEHDFVFVV